MVTFDAKLYVPPYLPLLHELMAYIHNDGHGGIQRTLHRLRRDFHTPNLCSVV